MRIHRLTGSVAMSLGLNSTPTCQFKSAAHRRKPERWPAIGGSVDAIRVRLAPSVEQSIKPLQTSQPRQQTFTAARAEAPKFPCSHVYLFPCSQLVPPIWGCSMCGCSASPILHPNVVMPACECEPFGG